MKKSCENCGNFSVFYTRIGIKYFQTNCGRCWTNKCIMGCQETCEKWETKIVNKKVEQKELLNALDEALTHIGVIKEKLTEE